VLFIDFSLITRFARKQINLHYWLTLQSLNSSFEDKVEVFAVAGSFNDLKYAFERSMLFRNYTTHIIENPEHSPTRFRVVIGPLEDKSLVHKITMPGDLATDTLWVTELCTEDLSPPPCGPDGLLAIAAQAERAGI